MLLGPVCRLVGAGGEAARFGGKHGGATLTTLLAATPLAAAVAEVTLAVPSNGKKHKICHGSACLHYSKCQVAKGKTAERDIETRAN